MNYSDEEWIEFINDNFQRKKLLGLTEKNSGILLKEFFLDNVPIEFKAHLWMLLSGGFLHLKDKGKTNRFSDFKLLHENEECPRNLRGNASFKGDSKFLKKTLRYGDYMGKAKEKVADQIKKDLDRTIWPYYEYLEKDGVEARKAGLNKKDIEILKELDVYFKAQAQSILEAYSVVDPEIAYVQGMHAVCITVVYHFHLAKFCFENFEEKQKISMKLEFTEEEAFFIFYGIMTHLKLREAYSKDFVFLQNKIDSFGKILQKKVPEVYSKLTENQVNSTILNV
jgi:hypothetical protein